MKYRRLVYRKAHAHSQCISDEGERGAIRDISFELNCSLSLWYSVISWPGTNIARFRSIHKLVTRSPPLVRYSFWQVALQVQRLSCLILRHELDQSRIGFLGGPLLVHACNWEQLLFQVDDDYVKLVQPKTSSSYSGWQESGCGIQTVEMSRKDNATSKVQPMSTSLRFIFAYQINNCLKILLALPLYTNEVIPILPTRRI